MDDSDPEINLFIPLKSIYEEFFCPICYDIIKECTMTQCSHNFCKECLMECLNRKKICPCCNAVTTPQQASPNKQFDRLIAIIQDEKEKSSKEYFENLINASNKTTTSSTSPYGPQQTLSPIEQLFHTHMKRSLLAYEEYYQNLKSKSEISKQQILEKYTLLMQNHQNQQKGRKGLTISQDNQINHWKAECEGKISEISESFEKSVELLRTSYDDYMKALAPPAQFLPITVNVTIPNKNEIFRNIRVNPTDTASDLKQVVLKRMEGKGDPVIGFDSKNFFVLINGADFEGIPILDESIPILQYHPDPGATLELKGNLRCKSDAPKQCFKQTYVKDANMVMDYFRCKECEQNWLCKTCADTCHKGHSIVEFALNHIPSWSCCYCSKKGKCLLSNQMKKE